MYLSVIIPAYNEGNRIKKTLVSVGDYLSKQNYDSEILVVDDGSRDGTAEVVKGLIPEIKNLKVIGYGNNRGKGYAVRFGMLKAKGDYRLFMDADNSTSIDQVEKMWPYFEKGFDVVIGSRDVKGAVLEPPQPLYRRFLGEGFGFLVSLICGLWGIKDSQCGFKGFTGKAAEKIFKKATIDRFAFDPEILVIARKLGYKIKEVPVIWKNSPGSKVKASSIFNMAIDLLKIRLNIIFKKYER